MKLCKDALITKVQLFNELIDLFDTLELVVPYTLNEFVWYNYIMLQRTDQVAKLIDSHGIRIKTRSRKGSRKFKHTDVTDLIINDIDSATNPLQKISYCLYKYNFCDYSLSKTCRELKPLKALLFTPEFNIIRQPFTELQINDALYSKEIV